MKLIGSVLRRSVCWRLAYNSKHPPQLFRRFSANTASAYDDREGSNSFESADDFERRMFSDGASDSKFFSLFQKYDRIQKDQASSDLGSKMKENKIDLLDGLIETSSTLSDGLDGKLKKEATYFEFDLEEIEKDENYSFRPDIEFRLGEKYEPKDLDLTKPGVSKPFKRYEFETTTKEVLRKADFRNVRFLANFITEAGVIIKRSKTKISAKAQRKVAREIKTARAFGLMPFTTMGTKQFMFGRTMEDHDEDYEYETSAAHNFVDNDPRDTTNA